MGKESTKEATGWYHLRESVCIVLGMLKAGLGFDLFLLLAFLRHKGGAGTGEGNDLSMKPYRAVMEAFV